MSGGLDTDLRPVIAPPPARDGIIPATVPAGTRDRLPVPWPYAWNDGAEVLTPREIVARLYAAMGVPEYPCCEHCEHGPDGRVHTRCCPEGCNDETNGGDAA